MPAPACRFAFAVDTPAGHRCGRHRHACAELVVILSGDGVLHLPGGRSAYHPGSALFYPAGMEHWVEQRRQGRQLCFGLAGGLVDRLAPGVRRVPAAAEALVGLAVRELAGSQDPGRLDLLAGLLTSYLAEATPETRTPARGARDQLAYADSLLRAHLDRPFAAGELADALFISPGYLRQIFQRAYGHGPMHHLLRLRVEHAQRLLRDDALTVEQVATRCGFASPFHFSRVFTRLAGTPPAAWGKAARAGAEPPDLLRRRGDPNSWLAPIPSTHLRSVPKDPS